MQFEIKHRYTGAVLYAAEIDCEPGAPQSWKLALRAALDEGVDLGGADLRGADLRWADLYCADLY